MDIQTLRAAYLDGSITPADVIEQIIARTSDQTNPVWIHRLSDAALRASAQALDPAQIANLPLYGIPFAIKDNIDLAGVPTSAACPEYTYVPTESAFVVQQLVAAGALPIGKTNLDQFATGLNGTRSPYGACRNAFNTEYVSGGSSSGSAVAVALGYCSFALGTDTAGSGRVPAAFNNLVGHKPTCGWLSARGVVPACKSLDTISILALTAEDAEWVMKTAAVQDPQDPFSRKAQGHGFDFGRVAEFRLGVPRAADLEFFGDQQAQALFRSSVERLQALGAVCVEVDMTPFLETARLLYEGPWVAERYAAIRDFFDTHAHSTLPVIQTIIGGARKWSAADAYHYGYLLKAQKRVCDAVWSQIDCMVTPTTGTIYSIAEMQDQPIKLNSNLGYYTNFMNLLDYAATAVPTGFYDCGEKQGLPVGVTLFAPAHQDGPLLHLAARLQRASVLTAGALAQPLPPLDRVNALGALPDGQVKLVVCGAHMRGLPLNHQLQSRGAHLVGVTHSAACYKLYALAGGPPFRPAMVRVAEQGTAIEVEVWSLPASEFGSFVAGIPAPLGIGPVVLSDASVLQGFVCDALMLEGARDISHYGGWRAYLRDAAKPN